MADISLIQDDSLDDSDEGVFEQGDGPSGGPVDDDSLPPLLRIQKYAKSENVFDRQMVPRLVLELFRTGPAEFLSNDLPYIMNVVVEMAEKDEIMVRTDLLEQVPNLSATALDCSNRVPGLSNILSDYLLPLVVKNLGNIDNQIRKTAHSALFVLMEKNLITRQQVEIQVCPTVLALSNLESIMDYHTSIVTLMSKLTPFLGRELTERVFLQRFSQLCSNHMFYVRKVCVSHFGEFCAVIGKDAYEHILLPCYITLCSDDVWGVRKACAEVVMSVSCACPATKRRSILAPAFARLLQDENRWVRMAAFQTLGPFISTFADPTITSLAYNNLRELVLVNNEGVEFRISPTYSDTNILRSVGELHMLHQYQEFPKDIKEESNVFGDKEDDDTYIFDPFGDLENSNNVGNSDCKEINIENVALEIDINNAEENNTEEEVQVQADSWQNCVTEKTVVDDKMDVESLIETLRQDLCIIDFKELLGFPKNELPRPLDNTQSKSCDNLDKVANDESNSEQNEMVMYSPLLNNDHCYVLNECLSSSKNNSDNSDNSSVPLDTVNQGSIDNQNGNHVEKLSNKNIEVENLDQYNSYNYWYIRPDMPLDSNIVNSDVSSQPQESKETRDAIKENFVRHFNTLSPSLNNFDFQKQSVPECPKMDNLTNRFKQLQLNKGKQPPVVEVKPLLIDIEPPQHIVPQLLIDHFVSMTNPSLAQEGDNEMAYHCAYSLPAVALTLGSKNWHLLKDTVEVLAANMQYKVRRTVASSLHELAIILGTDIATNNLTPIFEGFIKDLDEVRIGVLKHLAHFLKLISPTKRNIFLPRLADFLYTDNISNWRFRQEFAEQLLLAIPLFRPNDSTKYISALAQELLCDKVAAVREIALLLVTELIRHISPDQTLTSRFLVKLAEKFAHSKRWKRRQTFALLCSELLNSKALHAEQFACEVMPHLLDLSWDPVPNVRLVVARTISQHIVTNEYFADVSNQHYDGLQTVLRRLQSDKDRDVRQSAIFQKLTNID